ncbi:MAG: phosphatase PAP2 family protein [Solirubrobacteraceae bacterium]
MLSLRVRSQATPERGARERARAARPLWRLYPVAIAFVVIVTANHLPFDVAAGALIAVLAACLAPRLTPLAWRLRSLHAPAQAA